MPENGHFCLRKTFFEHAKLHSFARNFLCYKKENHAPEKGCGFLVGYVLWITILSLSLWERCRHQATKRAVTWLSEQYGDEAAVKQLERLISNRFLAVDITVHRFELSLDIVFPHYQS